MEVDGSRLLYLESCEGLVGSLKAENEQLKNRNTDLNEQVMNIQEKFEVTRMNLDSKTEMYNYIKANLHSLEEETSKIETENAQLRKILKETREFFVDKENAELLD